MSNTMTTGLKPLAVVTAYLEYEHERFSAEAQFADALCRLHPEQAAGWQPLIAQARAQVAAAVDGGSLPELRAAVRAAETLLAPLGVAAKQYTVHCVGHAHIDMNWMWSWPETVSVTNDTFTTVLRLMDEYPDFKFSQSQASVYKIMEQHNPDLLARIAQRVKEGRWEVTASHWVEGDKNLAGGESLTRHLLYTRRYMQQLFDLAPDDVPIDWAPDTFGHAATIPTYLTRGGVKYVYLHRPGTHSEKKPDAFWWQAPDGARVLVFNQMKYGYNMTLTPDLGRLMADFATEYHINDFLAVYGVGDHGGGPTRRDLERGLDLATWPIFPRIQFSTAKVYYETLAAQGANLPVIATELNTEFTGCYTTQSLVKKVCRFGESRLKDAEAAAVAAWTAAGFTYPTAKFTEGWTDILFNHFHDILPGSGVHDTRTYTHGLYQKTVAATAQIEAQALRLLASQVDTTGSGLPQPSPMPPSALANSLGAGVGFHSADGALVASDQSTGDGPRPFLLFNPTAIARSEVVRATLWNNGRGRGMGDRHFQVRCPDGSTVAAQMVEKGGFWGHDYATVAFPASVPALGYATYIVEEIDVPAEVAQGAWQTGIVHHCSYALTERSPEGLENAFLRVELDPVTGGIKRLIDKASGKTIVADAPLLEYAVERPHPMSAWHVDHTGPIEYPAVTALTRKDAGPHTASIAVQARIHESDFTVVYELRAGDPQLYVHINGVWFQRGTPQTGVPMLSYALPVAVDDAKARYEIPFGAIDRDQQVYELPALQWAQVTGTQDGAVAGCQVLNDTKHGYSLTGSTLRLSLIHSSYDPDILPEIGQHDIHLALRPFTGEQSVEQSIAAGDTFNHTLRVVGTDVHAGTLPTEAAGITLSPATVTLSGIKKAEDRDTIILRLYETAGKPTTAAITINPLLGAVTGASEVDLLERYIDTCTASVDRQTVSVQVPAYGIASVEVMVRK